MSTTIAPPPGLAVPFDERVHDAHEDRGRAFTRGDLKLPRGDVPVDADHQSWHSVAAFRNRMHLYDVNADRRGKVDGYGHVQFSADKNDDRSWPMLAAAEAVVYLAPEMARAFTKEFELGQDRKQVKELWASLGSPPGWIEARRTETLAFVTDPENVKRFTRIARELIDRGAIPGPEAEAFLEVWGC